MDESLDWIGVAIESPADTLGGHIVHVLGRVPTAGVRLPIDGAEIEVERVTANSIVSLLVRPAVPPAEKSGGEI
jgi:CBS domain containing-hemolysin-like protein